MFSLFFIKFATSNKKDGKVSWPLVLCLLFLPEKGVSEGQECHVRGTVGAHSGYKILAQNCVLPRSYVRLQK